MKNILSVLALILLSSLSTDAGSAEKYYKWTDKNGVVQITDDPRNVPEENRSSAQEIKTEGSNMKILADRAWKWVRTKEELITTSILAILLLTFLYKFSIYSKSKLKNSAQKRHTNKLEKIGVNYMTNEKFRNFIAELLKKNGYRIRETETEIIKFDIDIAEKKGEKYAVLINNQTGVVSRIAVNEADREKHRYKCAKSMVVTRGCFSDDAKDLALRTGCLLVDRDGIAEWI